MLMKTGRAGAPFEPRRRPQAGKSGDPRSQNADSDLGDLEAGVVEVLDVLLEGLSWLLPDVASLQKIHFRDDTCLSQ